MADTPHSVPIVEVAGNAKSSFRWNTSTLETILLNPKYANKKVALISVAGAYRKGKSFLLNFFIRYLKSITVYNPDYGMERQQNEWLSPSSKLEGFSWRHGRTADTKGILIWSQPFLVEKSNREEVVVLLMDTQGAFDSQSTVKDCATIFAFSTMISSVQIYNLSQNVQEDDLQHLQLFAEYGRLAKEKSRSKPFQSLMFLIRDWQCPQEAAYGFKGGEKILNETLEVSEGQHAELRQLRQDIRGWFEKLQCFLMPHPGLRVATNHTFDGKLDEVEPEFKEMLQVLVPKLLQPDNLVLKKINSKEITCRELLEYFKGYAKVFQEGKLPDLLSVFTANAEVNNQKAVTAALKIYNNGMELRLDGNTSYLSTEELNNLHERFYKNAIQCFDAKKMGEDALTLNFLKNLETDLKDSFQRYQKFNDTKNLEKTFSETIHLMVLFVVQTLLNYKYPSLAAALRKNGNPQLTDLYKGIVSFFCKKMFNAISYVTMTKQFTGRKL